MSATKTIIDVKMIAKVCQEQQRTATRDQGQFLLPLLEHQLEKVISRYDANQDLVAQSSIQTE